MPDHQLYPIRQSIRGQGSAAAIDTLNTAPVLEGWTWLVLAWGARDVETDATAIRPFVESGGQRYYLPELAPTAANQQVGANLFQLLGPGERFGVEVTGSVANDDLVLDLFGLMFPPGVELTPQLLQALAGLASPE